jgi:probable rRNA maturation factor
MSAKNSRPVKIYCGHPKLRLSRPAITAAIHALDAAAATATDCARGTWKLAPGELSLAFLTDAALARLHADFLDDPTTTDVITFPGAAEHGQAGEVCISVDTAREYAVRHGTDLSAELTLYVVHGYLHLSGYDDLKPATRRQMRAGERQALAALRTAGKLPAFTLAG